jgi:hypothetical protein
VAPGLRAFDCVVFLGKLPSFIARSQRLMHVARRRCAS